MTASTVGSDAYPIPNPLAGNNRPGSAGPFLVGTSPDARVRNGLAQHETGIGTCFPRQIY